VIKNFNNCGYHIEKDIYPKNMHKEIFFIYYDLGISLVRRNKINLHFEPKKIENLIYPNDIKELDKLLIAISNIDYKSIGELYDTVCYSSAFLKFIGNSKIEKIAKELLGLKNYSTIYCYLIAILIQAPLEAISSALKQGAIKRVYGWHQEIMYTMPDTRLVATWAPIIRDTTAEHGAIEICKGSHKEGVFKASWNDIKGSTTQILVDEDIVNRYEKITIPMKTGDVLFFHQDLIHRSGRNSTKEEIRFSLVAQWNDCSYTGFKVPLPVFKSRTIGAKENFDKVMSQKKN